MNINALNSVPKAKELRDAANVGDLVKLLSSNKDLTAKLREMADLREEITKKYDVVSKEEAEREKQLQTIKNAEQRKLSVIAKAEQKLNIKEDELLEKNKQYEAKTEELKTLAADLASLEKTLSKKEQELEKREKELNSVLDNHTQKANAAIKKAEKAEAEAMKTKQECDNLIAKMKALTSN